VSLPCGPDEDVSSLFSGRRRRFAEDGSSLSFFDISGGVSLFLLAATALGLSTNSLGSRLGF
jgi:hypothetical protein